MDHFRKYGVVVMVSLLGCVATALTPVGEKVRVGNAAPHEGCRELGIVTGSGGGGAYTGSEYKATSAQNELRNRTAEKGGDFVVLDSSVGDIHGVTFTGRAFDCSAGAPPPAAVPVVAPTSGGSTPVQQQSVEERLQKVDELHQKGLISDDERTQRRSEILQSI